MKTCCDRQLSDTSVTVNYVKDTSLTDTFVTDTSVTGNSVTDNSVTDTSVTDTSVTDNSVTVNSVTDPSVTDTSAGLDKSGVRTPQKRFWATRIRGLVAQRTTKISQGFFSEIFLI